MAIKPKKSTGGYINLDLGGMNLSESGVDYQITDPELLKILRAIYDYDVCKPIYISNFLLNGNRYGVIPMIYAGDSNDCLISMHSIPDVERILITLDEAPEIAYARWTQA